MDDHGAGNYIHHSMSRRITHDYILPLFFLLIIILFVQVIKQILKKTPILSMMHRKSSKRRMRNAKIFDVATTASEEISSFDIYTLRDPLRREVAPLTGTYFRFLPPMSLWTRLQVRELYFNKFNHFYFFFKLYFIYVCIFNLLFYTNIFLTLSLFLVFV